MTWLAILFWGCIALGVAVCWWIVAIARAERDEWWDR